MVCRDETRRWTREVLVEAFERSAPRYRGMVGLRPKAYPIDEERGQVGGFYVWESREQLAAVQQTDRWRAMWGLDESRPDAVSRVRPVGP